MTEKPQILARGEGVSIAYHRSRGRGPGVAFLGGFMSDMTGTKAMALEAFCRSRGQAFLRFDYQGHGQSSGRFEDGCIGTWSEDAIAALDALTEGPQILVGSSMGGWIMLLAALARPARVAALVGIAAAPDFVTRMWDEFTPEIRRTIVTEGVYRAPSQYSETPYAITHRLIEDGRRHLLLGKPIPLRCPVRLLHGMKDPDVPWDTSLALAGALESADVDVILAKEGDHRLSTPADLERLCATIAALSDQVG
jgi:pimeloyl-ACP methyl ester carboxylesterase